MAASSPPVASQGLAWEVSEGRAAGQAEVADADNQGHQIVAADGGIVRHTVFMSTYFELDFVWPCSPNDAA